MNFLEKVIKASDTIEQFSVNIDLLSELNIDRYKRNSKARLIKSYIKDVDFIILGDNLINDKIGRPKEQIMLSADCFKKMCIFYNTEMAKQARQYYIFIETLIKKFEEDKKIKDLDIKNNIIDKNIIYDENTSVNDYKKLLKRINKLNDINTLRDLQIAAECVKVNKSKTHHKYYVFETKPVFYIITTTNGDIKPGVTKDVNVRFKSYRTLDPLFKINLIMYTEQNSLLETYILSKYSKFKITNNHESLDGKKININDVIKSIMTFIPLANITYEIDDNIIFYNKDVSLMDNNHDINDIDIDMNRLINDIKD